MAGGQGTRMFKNGIYTPKFLLRITDKTLAEHTLEALKTNGIEDVYLFLGKNADLIEPIAKEICQDLLLNCVVYAEQNALGTGGSIINSLDLLPEEFLVLYGDLLINTDLSKIMNVFQNKNCDFAQMTHASSHVFDSDILSLNLSKQITSYHIKPHVESLVSRNRCNTGIYAFRRRIFRDFIGIKRAIDLDREILPELVSTGKNGIGIVNTGYVKDIGTPNRFQDAKKHFSNFVLGSSAKPTIFLDRDGTINYERGHITSSEQIALLPGASRSILRLNQAGYRVLVVTNQPVIARGEVSPEELDRIHATIDTELAKVGAIIDEYYFCPHYPIDGFPGEITSLKIDCECRKPQKGLLELAAREFPTQKEKSWIIGDSWSDVKAGENFGIRALKLRSTKRQNEGYDYAMLSNAVDFLLKENEFDLE